MIYLDRIMRYVKGDIYLPKRCYVPVKVGIDVKKCCDCKLFCRKVSGKGKLSSVKIKSDMRR